MERSLLRCYYDIRSVAALSSRYWNGIVPERCKLQFKEGEEWNCFFGYKIYPTLRCKYWRRESKWILGFSLQITYSNVCLLFPSFFFLSFQVRSLLSSGCLMRPSLLWTMYTSPGSLFRRGSGCTSRIWVGSWETPWRTWRKSWRKKQRVYFQEKPFILYSDSIYLISAEIGVMHW